MELHQRISEPSTSTRSRARAAVARRIEYGMWWQRAPRWRMSSSPRSGDSCMCTNKLTN